MPTDTQLAVTTDGRASSALAAFIGMAPDMMMDTIRAQCFRNLQPGQEVTDFQLAAFISIAHEMKVNPLLPGMLFAFPVQGGGIVPIMGPDAVYKKLAENKEVDSWQVDVYPDTGKPTHAIAQIWRKGSERPLKYTAEFEEWYVEKNPNWKSRPRHMLQLRALKHCARQVIHGIPFDEDERHIAEEVNVTPGASGQPAAPQNRPAPPPKAMTGAALVAENPQPKAKGRAKKPEAAIDVPTTPVPDAPPAAAEETPPAEQEKAPETPPRIGLAVGEKLTFTKVRVVSVIAKVINNKPGVVAQVEGSFTGKVYHLGGATQDREGMDPKPKAEWKVGNLLTLVIEGKPGQTAGVVFNMIQSATLEAPESETLE